MNPQNNIPPRLATRLLTRLIRDDLAEEVLGDLEEKFYAVAEEKSLFRARLNYWYQVFHYIRPFAVRKGNPQHSNYNGMYRNYFKTAYRNLLKNRLHSITNITGLSVGMAVTILIGIWIWDELSYDKVHPHYARIGQVIQNVHNNGEIQTWGNVPYPLADELRASYSSDFESIVLTSGNWDHILTYENAHVTKTGLFAEPGFSEMFSLHLINGSGKGLKEASSIMLSKSLASALFPHDDPLDKIVKIDNDMSATVVGIYEDLPENSSFSNVHFVAPWQLLYNETSWIKTMDDPWRPNAFTLYVQLTEQADLQTTSQRIKDAKLKKLNADLAKKKPELFIFPMSSWHLYSDFKNGVNTGGRIQYVWMFGIIGVFVLMLACINFMNLSTARSEKRAKEVGIRKAIGSVRSQLIGQFLTESLLVVLFSFIAAQLMAQLALPFFNQLADKSLVMPWQAGSYWLISVGFCLITSLVSGSYPALYLSGFQTVKVLKGTFRSGKKAVIFRRVLVVTQFTVSIALIIGTTLVFQQVEFARDRPIGYETNGLISIPIVTNEIHQHFDAVKHELLSSGAVLSVAEASSAPTSNYGSTSGIVWRGKDPNLSTDFPFARISHDYGKTIGWEIVDGRDFDSELSTESDKLILNEAAVKYMGLENPVEEPINWFGTPYKVIGVVSDIITQSPYAPVRPTIYQLSDHAGDYVLVRLNPAKSASRAIEILESILIKFNPAQSFEYEFIDDQYAQKFGNEVRIGRLAAAFAILAILISCLGIFGLASFVAEQRTKEIGIRKVLGASIADIWVLISSGFMGLVGVSFLIATPVSYYLLQEWLTNYEYHVSISWWIFAVAGIGALLITLITVSYQTLRAAMANSVQNLRTE